MNARRAASQLAGLACAALLLAACSRGIKGTYRGGDDSLLHSLNFKDDGKVDVVIANGIGGEGTYEVDGDVVRITANGQTNELKIGDDGCLHGPLLVGTLCKGERPSGSAAAAPSGGGSGLAGSTFEARGNGGVMSLQFTDGRSVRVISAVPTGGGSGSVEGTYSSIGDQVVIDIQGDAQTFTLNGNTLTGDLDGDQVTFTRK
jgi:hypothetical protein